MVILFTIGQSGAKPLRTKQKNLSQIIFTESCITNFFADLSYELFTESYITNFLADSSDTLWTSLIVVFKIKRGDFSWYIHSRHAPKL